MIRRAAGWLLAAAFAAALAGCSLGPDRVVRKAEPASAPPARCAPLRRPIDHVVRKGETLGQIAQCYRVPWKQIARDNGIRDPNRIRAGQTLRIRPRGAAALPAGPPPTRQASGIAWRWPVTGKLLRKFSGRGSGKQGIAIAGELGRRVVATAAGRVVYRGELLPIFDAAERYRADGTPLIVLAGKEYGCGSSRDWAAKGPRLQGVRAVLAESYERIHRSNLIGMGILPLQFRPGDSTESLGLSGEERFGIAGLADGALEAGELEVRARAGDGAGEKSFKAAVRIDTPQEAEYYRHGGILPYVLRQLAA